MHERTQLSLKLILSHVILLPVLILLSRFINSDSFLLTSITETVLIILILSGYWEFLGLRFKRVYFVISEVLIFMVFSWKLFSVHKAGNNLYLIFFLAIIQIWILFLLIKIIIVIFRSEKGAVEIEFPFKQGSYLITDGGNSRISRLMNYHFFSRLHKEKKTNLSMLFATDIVKIKDSGSIYFPSRNDDYPIFGETSHTHPVN